MDAIVNREGSEGLRSADFLRKHSRAKIDERLFSFAIVTPLEGLAISFTVTFSIYDYTRPIRARDTRAHLNHDFIRRPILHVTADCSYGVVESHGIFDFQVLQSGHNLAEFAVSPRRNASETQTARRQPRSKMNQDLARQPGFYLKVSRGSLQEQPLNKPTAQGRCHSR